MWKFVASVFFVVGCSAWKPKQYPYYCSKDMSTRQITPLSDTEQQLVGSIKQVQAIIRHGSRTPYALFSCWEDYHVTWQNCNITEIMLASPTMTGEEVPKTWYFRKLYDGSPNLLGGNCFTGQLLSEGYEQEVSNGEYLRDAYVGTSPLHLFRNTTWGDFDLSKIYLRSDDEQRTLMSGQILIHSMFNISNDAVIDWHTGDYALDTLSPNANVCPKMNDVSAAAYGSDEYIAHNTSKDMKHLVSSLDDVFGEGYWDWNHVLDCLMTTVCTNRDIPSGMTQDLFDDAVATVEYNYAYRSLYNSSQWAKLAMGEVAYDISTRLQAAMSDDPDAYSFVLYGGHDTTIMPLLAAIQGDEWDGKWSAYASMLVFELYSNADIGKNDMFRLLYDGNPLTLPGCDAPLCDATVLIDLLSFGQKPMPCDAAEVKNDKDGGDDDKFTLSTMEWVWILVFTMLCGMVVGMLILYATVSRSTPTTAQYTKLENNNA